MSLALFIRRGLDPDSRPICIYRHPENKENISPDNLPLSHLLCLYDLRNCISLQGKQNSFEMKVWRTSLRGKVRLCVQESQTPRTAVCLGRFALLRSKQGLHPLRHFAAIILQNELSFKQRSKRGFLYVWSFGSYQTLQKNAKSQSVTIRRTGIP